MTRPIRVLELRSVRGTGGGPEKTILYGAARTDPRRFAVTVCYLRDRRDRIFSIDGKAAELGVQYVEVIERHSLDPAIFGALRRIVRAQAIDIVHAHEYKTDILAYLLSRCEPVIPLATVHGWTGHSRRERLVYYPLDKMVLSRFPRLIAVSGDIRSVLIKKGTPPDRVSVVLNGIDHRIFRRDDARRGPVRAEMGFEPNDFVIGAVGRLEPQKRFDILIEAVARLLPLRPAVKLVIAGDGSLRTALERQALTCLPQSAFRLLGNTPDVIRLHHAFDVFVQASDYEGTPNAVLEAMALETPIVATNVGGTSEIAADGVQALIVPPGDSSMLADAIERTLIDPGGARQRAVFARRRVEGDLSFEARMQAVESIYEELAAPRSASEHKEMLRWT